MAGFALNLKLLLQKPQARQKCRANASYYIENDFLQELGIPMTNFEIRASNGTKDGFWCDLQSENLLFDYREL